MIAVIRKTTSRTGWFLGQALGWRRPDREHGAVAWGLVAGAIWLVIGTTSIWPEAVAGFYLVVVLAAVCAIDARYGIIPDSLVIALALGGLFTGALGGLEGLLERGIEAVVVSAAALLFRGSYRLIRGNDGLGLGDVKFVAAATLWVGIASIPAMLLTAVSSAFISLLILRSEGHLLDGKQAISFGPHLALAVWLVWVARASQIEFF